MLLSAPHSNYRLHRKSLPNTELNIVLLQYDICQMVPTIIVSSNFLQNLLCIFWFSGFNAKLGFPDGPSGKASGLGRSPGEENGNPLQYYCLENSMDRGPWQATVHSVTKSWSQLSDWACMQAITVINHRSSEVTGSKFKSGIHHIQPVWL